MKKIITTVVTIFCFVNLQAQFEVGSKWIAGSANFSLSNNEGAYSSVSNMLSIGCRASINTFVSDNVMNSIFVGYSYSGGKVENSSNPTTKNQSHNLQFGFGKTHIKPLFGKVYSTITTNFYGEYYFEKTENNSFTGQVVNETKKNNYSANINIGLGLLYRVADRFAVTTSLNNFLYGNIGINNQTNFNLGSTETTSKGVGINGGCGLSGFNFGNLQFGLLYRLKQSK
jgi:hypothetical protein